jgi:hypothetical protein
MPEDDVVWIGSFGLFQHVLNAPAKRGNRNLILAPEPIRRVPAMPLRADSIESPSMEPELSTSSLTLRGILPGRRRVTCTLRIRHLPHLPAGS